MDKVVVVVPSLNPDDKLLAVVTGLIDHGFKKIIVVNDGSSTEYEKYFNEVASHSECTVLKHYKNLGKGRALKTAFNYYLNNYQDYNGIITVDADNQHHIDDIINCAKALENHQDSLILGCRNFNLPHVPKKSRFGNKLTRFIFKSMCGIAVSDTQTGLRGFPTALVEEFVDIFGERYEYETTMLIETKKKNIPIFEVPIQTIYIEENKSSHFNPIRDSIRIYSLIFKFLWASLASSVIDLGLFTLFMYIFRNYEAYVSIFISTILARVISSLCNFFINKNVVFNNNSLVKSTIVKYYILATIQMFLSYVCVNNLFSLLQINATLIKLIVDVILFFISFQIQREWVFKNY